METTFLTAFLPAIEWASILWRENLQRTANFGIIRRYIDNGSYASKEDLLP